MRDLAIIIAITVFLPGRVHAHHEAIFGPQSALVLSSAGYVTAQLFTRQTGPDSDRVQETTTVLSAGLAPFKQPVSVALIVPFSVLTGTGGMAGRAGLEDAILGVRYRADLPGVTRALSGKESFVMGVGAAELPTGTLDHRFGRDALAVIAAGLMGVEVGEFSAIGYGFFRRQGTYHDAREGANLFLGGGVAWTPLDEPTGRLVSLQLGVSREAKFKEQQDGASLPDTGGWGVFAHPTILVGLSQHVMVFGQTSLPIEQRWRDPADRDRFRFGAGLILTIGH